MQCLLNVHVGRWYEVYTHIRARDNTLDLYTIMVCYDIIMHNIRVYDTYRDCRV